MGGKAEGRLYRKEPLHSLGIELERDFGLSAIASRALVQRIGEFTVVEDTMVTAEQMQPGQLLVLAPEVGCLDSGERLGSAVDLELGEVESGG